LNKGLFKYLNREKWKFVHESLKKITFNELWTQIELMFVQSLIGLMCRALGGKLSVWLENGNVQISKNGSWCLFSNKKIKKLHRWKINTDLMITVREKNGLEYISMICHLLRTWWTEIKLILGLPIWVAKGCHNYTIDYHTWHKKRVKNQE
jgi:hypothetical protein